MSERENLHSVWCDHRPSNDPHDDNIPYCLKQIHGVKLIPTESDDHPKVWVYATSSAHPEALASRQRVVDDQRFEGVELTVEQRVGDDWTEQTMRLASDAARSLAAALIRAADIEQGLTR